MSAADRDTEYLLWRFVNEELAAGEEERVAEALERDPDLARMLYRLADQRLVLAQGMAATRRARRTRARAATEETARPRPVRFRTGRWLAVAACLAIVVGSLVYNYNRSGKLGGAIVAHVRETAPGVQIIRDGQSIVAVVDMEIRVRDRIETGRAGTLTFTYDGEDTEVEVLQRTMLDIGGDAGKTLNIDMGIIDAVVAPQDAGRPMTIGTKTARCDIVSTALKVTAKKETTRLDVFEGLVRMTCLSDGAVLEVPAGKFAAVGEGVAFHVMSIPPRDLEARGITPDRPDVPGTVVHEEYGLDGAVLYEDTFEDGLGDWEVVSSQSADEYTAVTRDPERFLSTGSRTLQDGTEVAYLRFDISGKEPAGTLLGIRSKYAVTAARCSLEIHMMYTGSTPSTHKWGIEYAGPVGIVDPQSQLLPVMPRVYRWEFTPPVDTHRREKYLCRRTMRKGSDVTPIGSARVNPTTGRIVIACAPPRAAMHVGGFEVYRVTVRELKEAPDTKE